MLLHLVRSAQVNIWDIPIASITEQYLAFLDSSEDLDLERTTEFYRMAATLLHIKSRLLLPPDVSIGDGEDEEDPRSILIEQLIEYQRLRMLGDALADQFNPMEWSIVPERRVNAVQDVFEDDIDQGNANSSESADVLLQLYQDLWEGMTAELPFDLDDGVTVAEKVTLLYERLEHQAKIQFETLVRVGSVVELICVLLAVLEVVKSGRARVIQRSPFSEISIEGCKV